jgi:hypothetical protein
MTGRFEDLVARHIDGTLDQAGAAELLTVVRDDPAARAEWLKLHRLHRLLSVELGSTDVTRRVAEALAAEQPSADRARRVRPSRTLRLHPRRRNWTIAAAVATAAAVIVTGLIVVMTDTPTAAAVPSVVEVQPATPASGVWTYPDGSQVSLAEGGRAERVRSASGAELVVLHQGRLMAAIRAQPSGQHFSVRTSRLLVEVVGTQFSVEAGSEDRVGVEEGVVQVTAGSHTGRLKAGESMAMTSAPTRISFDLAGREPDHVTSGEHQGGTVRSVATQEYMRSTGFTPDQVIIVQAARGMGEASMVTPASDARLLLRVRSEHAGRGRVILVSPATPTGARITLAAPDFTIGPGETDVVIPLRDMAWPANQPLRTIGLWGFGGGTMHLTRLRIDTPWNTTETP